MTSVFDDTVYTLFMQFLHVCKMPSLDFLFFFATEVWLKSPSCP